MKISENEFDKIGSYLNSNGYYKLAVGDNIAKYDYIHKDFNYIDLQGLKSLIKNIIGSDFYIYMEDLYKVRNNLKTIDNHRIEGFKDYILASDVLSKININQLEKELESILKLNNQKKTNDFSYINGFDVFIQRLINNDVFTDGRFLLKFDSDKNRFFKLSQYNIRDYNIDYEVYKVGMRLKKRLINVEALSDGLNKYNVYSEKLKETEEDYVYIKNIVED